MAQVPMKRDTGVRRPPPVSVFALAEEEARARQTVPGTSRDLLREEERRRRRAMPPPALSPGLAAKDGAAASDARARARRASSSQVASPEERARRRSSASMSVGPRDAEALRRASLFGERDSFRCAGMLKAYWFLEGTTFGGSDLTVI